MPTLVAGTPEAAETMVLMVLASMATTSVAMAPGDLTAKLQERFSMIRART